MPGTGLWNNARPTARVHDVVTGAVNGKSRQIAVRVPLELYADLEAFCKQWDSTLTEAVVWGLRQGFPREVGSSG